MEIIDDFKGVSFFADSHKGSYYINVIEDGINIFGEKAPIGMNRCVINVEKY